MYEEIEAVFGKLSKLIKLNYSGLKAKQLNSFIVFEREEINTGTRSSF